MKSRFAWDPLDPSDSFFDTAGAEFYWSFSPPASHAGSPPASSLVEIPSTPALTSEAAQSSGAQSGPTSTVSMTAGGITINLLFDAAAMAAPASFRAGIQQAASILTATISDKITVNIKIDYSGTGGGAAAGPDNGLYESYSTVRADLINNATPGDTTFNALPSGSSIQGQSNVAVWNAQLKLWGMLGANDTTTDDGSATFATDINSSLLVGVALHELTHAMGRVPYGPPYSSPPDIFDLFRFTQPRHAAVQRRQHRPAAYFSLDGGNTKLADYGQNSDPSDFLNSGVQGSNDPFNEFYTGSTLQSLTTVDKEQLDALGFHTATSVTGGANLRLIGGGDFAASGNADLAWQTAGGVMLWISNGSALTEAIVPSASMGAAWSAYGVGDFNDDGNADLLWTNNGGQVAIWEMNGANLIGFGVPAGQMGAEWKVAGIGDFNGNGDADILWVSTAGHAAIWTMSGTALAGFAVSNGAMGTEWHVGAIGDFNNDGRQDVLWENTSGQVDIWEMNGAKSFGVRSKCGPNGGGLENCGVGHFNGAVDSTSDIVWVNSVTNYVQIWQMQNGKIANIITPSGLDGTEWHLEAVGNFAGDANSDLLWISNSGAASIWKINGTSVQAISMNAPIGDTLQFSNSPSAAEAQLEGASGQHITSTNVGSLGGTETVTSGILSFAETGSTETHTVSVSPQNGGSGYLGNFTVAAIDGANARESVGWQFNFNSSSIARTATQSYDVTVAGNSANGTHSTVSQTVSITLGGPGDDTFVFKPGFGTQVVANAKSSDVVELDGFASVADINQLQALLDKAHAGKSQSLFQATNGGHDTLINLGNHDTITLANVKIADLHASNFIINV